MRKLDMGPSRRDKSSMVSAILDLTPKGLAQWLEGREQRRTGALLPDVRRQVARRAGISPGTIENVVRERLKRGIDLVRDRLLSLVIAELEAEVARDLHELEILKSRARPIDQEQIGEVLESLAKSRALLERKGEL